MLQLAVVGILPAADAALELAAAHDPVHVEPLGTDACDPSHEHQVCQLCRVLALAGTLTPVRATLAPPVPSRALAAQDRLHSFKPAPNLLGGLGPRAPPVA